MLGWPPPLPGLQLAPKRRPYPIFRPPLGLGHPLTDFVPSVFLPLLNQSAQHFETFKLCSELIFASGV